MRQRDASTTLDGVLVIDKPASLSSHDVVAAMRRSLRIEKVGHTGTLDPFATGVLPLVLGRAARLAKFLSAGDKVYRAVLRLGVETDTYDVTGVETARYGGPIPAVTEVAAALASFVGTHAQRPPRFSARRVGGKRAYELARAGVDVQLPARTATLSAAAMLNMRDAVVSIEATCSSGYYMRSLAFDLGRRLGVGASLVELTRTRCEAFTLADAVPLAQALETPANAKQRVLALERLLLDRPVAIVTPEGVQRASKGRELAPRHIVTIAPGAPGVDRPIRLVDPAGALIALAETPPTLGVLHPSIVLI